MAVGEEQDYYRALASLCFVDCCGPCHVQLPKMGTLVLHNFCGVACTAQDVSKRAYEFNQTIIKATH